MPNVIMSGKFRQKIVVHGVLSVEYLDLIYWRRGKMKQIFKVIDTRTGWDVTEDLERIALTEDWAKNLIYCDMQGWYIDTDGNLVLLDECGSYACPPEHYVVEFINA